MVLTTEEKACLVCLTLEIMNADYKITDNEMRFYALMQQDFSLSNIVLKTAKLWILIKHWKFLKTCQT